MTGKKIELTEEGKLVFTRRYQQGNESIASMFHRTCEYVAQAEKKEDREEWAEKFYELMSDMRFLANSPTYFNAGKEKGCLSACFALVVSDSMESILEVNRLSGMIQQAGGGVGYGFSRIRPVGSLIKSTHGKACGVVGLLHFYNSLAKLITQGGRRAGAQMGILSIDHPEIDSFIEVKNKNPEELSTFNISVALSDRFMENYMKEEEYAQVKLKKIAKSAWTTGDPGCYFIDTIEKNNPTPWLGQLESCNPCSEAPLLHAESCNLASINLKKYVLENTEQFFDWEKLKTDVETVIRFLDDVITVNNYPDPIIEEAVLKTRKIGLGIMGWADSLALLNIHYDTDIAVELAGKVMEFINDAAYQTSLSLGKERGVCLAFKGHPVPQLRNATRTCIAPTGSISILAGCSGGIEPHYNLAYTRTMIDRGVPVEMEILEPILKDLEERNSAFRPKTAYEIESTWHICHQAAFQEHVNLAISKTINLPEETTVEEIEEIFIKMWKAGLKGGTVFRKNCREFSPLQTKNTVTKIYHRRPLPDTRSSITHKFKVGDQKGYFTVGLYEDDSPGEIFITLAKEGTTISGTYNAIALLTSTCLQHGVSIETLQKQLSGMHFEPAGMTSNPEIPKATSIPDYIYRWLGLRFNSTVSDLPSGLFCPDCNLTLINSEGCLKCMNKSCGYERC